MVGCTITLALGYIAYLETLASANRDFVKISHVYRDRLTQSLQGIEADLLGMRTFFHASLQVGPDQFRIYATEVLNHHDEVHSLYYTPRVLDEDRSQHIRAMAEQGFPTYQIVELDRGQTRQAATRPVYYPIRFVEPLTPDSARLVGVDWAWTVAESDVITRAIGSGEAVSFTQEQRGGKELFLCAAVYAGKQTTPAVKEARIRAEKGMLVARVQMQRLLDELDEIGGDEFNVDLRIDDMAFSAAETVQTNTHGIGFATELIESEQIRFGQQIIELEFRQLLSWDRYWSPFPIIALLAGPLVTSLLVVYVAAIFNQHEKIRTLVAERTKQLREQSIRDSLSGLFNQRGFYESLEREIANAERFETRLSLIYFDLNGFKLLNDSAGHLQGDKVLAAVGVAIRRSIRASDIGCRYGGDEFAVIVPNGDTKVALDIYARLTVQLDQIVEHELVSISAGISETGPSTYESPEQMLAKVDALMYVAKKRARHSNSHQVEAARF